MKSLRRLGYYAIVFSVLASAPAAYAQSINATVNTGISAKVMDTSSVSAEVFTVTRGDVKDDEASVQNAADVSATADFDTYVRSTVKNDENISKVSSSKDEVLVWYKEHGKFLGFIPVTVSTKVVVQADGSVEVDRPWYTFLTMTDDKAQVEADIEATAGTIARAEGSTELSANTQARVVNALRSTMKARYDAYVAAHASTDSDVNVGY